MNLTALRQDASAAADALALLIPEEHQRRAVCEIFASSVRLAHRQAPDSWELTAWPHVVRLNVGQVAVLDVDSTELRLYAVQGHSLRAHGYRLTPFGNYRAVDVESECWAIPLSKAGSIVPSLMERHGVLIKEAARAKRVSPFKRYHSSGFIGAIAQLIKGVVPQPTYFVHADPELKQFEEAEDAARSCFGTPDSNRATEQAAVRLATATFTEEGWSVRSVERDHCGYDLHCVRRGMERHVEVKGTAGKPDRFIITAGEVRRAEGDPDFILVLVGGALGSDPTFESWTGSALLRTFGLEPIQYFARRDSI